MDQNYSVVRYQAITVPTTSVDLGSSSNRYGNLYMTGNLNIGNVVANESSLNIPKISTLAFPNSATAGGPSGGETVTLTGSGFSAGATVYIANVQVPVVTVVNSNTITFTSPVKADGSYTLTVVNTDGGSATFVPGITYSDFPVFSTASGSLGTAWEGNTVSTSVAATSDSAVTYAVSSGALPSGLSLSSLGSISGTLAIAPSGNTTYNFTVTASDVEQQKTNRNFSYTVQGDAVTWSSPADNSTISATYNSPISNIVLSASSALGMAITYSANVLPTGLVLSGNTISGTPSVVGNTTSLISASTTKTSSIQVTFSVPNPFLLATGGTVTTSGNYKIHTFTTSGTFTVTSTPGALAPVQILVVGGGGSGGYYYDAGGGGAGAAIYASAYTFSTAGSFTVTVGAGGAGGGSRTNGGDSTFNTSTAKGGGAGGSPDGGLPGNAGGCGGGGAGLNGSTAGKPGGASNQGAVSGFTVYGSAGGTGSMINGVPYGAGGGGGGCGGAGNSTTTGTAAAGGIGIANPITESTIGQLVSTTYYIGGGGGGGSDYAPAGAGGQGGGGKGQGAGSSASVAGSTNTGGGGGGSSRYTQYSNSNGGSGVVIIRYQFQ